MGRYFAPFGQSGTLLAFSPGYQLWFSNLADNCADPLGGGRGEFLCWDICHQWEEGVQEVFHDTWGTEMLVASVGVNWEEMGDVFVEWELVFHTPRVLPQRYFVPYN